MTTTWPIGSLPRALADRAAAIASGTHVDARDLGVVPGYYPKGFVVVTPELHAALATGAAAARAWLDRNCDAQYTDGVHVYDDGRTEPEITDAVFAGERAVREMNTADAAEAHADFVDQLVQGGHVAYVGGDDADDWDTDDGPANDDEAVEAASHEAVEAARAAGVTVPSPGYPYSVHNPFTSRQVWFVSGADARAYARAASAADVLDGDLGVWSASGPEDAEYWPFKGGRAHAEA
jgi:hypothetical protein